MTATGVSLIRLVREGINAPAGSLAWLVSVEPAGEAGGGPAPSGPGGAQTSPTNFYVVAVAATNGHFIAAAHGYTPPAPAQ